MIRLVPNQADKIVRTGELTFVFDGQNIRGHVGETVLAALMRTGLMHLRDAPNDKAPRGAFCCMGLCQECVVSVNGVNVESCRQLVHEGLVVDVLKKSRDDD